MLDRVPDSYDVNPTCVGMNRKKPQINCGTKRKPHMRGDEPENEELKKKVA